MDDCGGFPLGKLRVSQELTRASRGQQGALHEEEVNSECIGERKNKFLLHKSHLSDDRASSTVFRLAASLRRATHRFAPQSNRYRIDTSVVRRGCMNSYESV